jgi:hypothetical protein
MAKPTVILIGADKGAWARRRWPLRCYTMRTAVGVTTACVGIISFDPFFLSTLDTLPLSVLYRIAHLGQIPLKVDRQYLVSYKNRLENLERLGKNRQTSTPVESILGGLRRITPQVKTMVEIAAHPRDDAQFKRRYHQDGKNDSVSKRTTAHGQIALKNLLSACEKIQEKLRLLAAARSCQRRRSAQAAVSHDHPCVRHAERSAGDEFRSDGRFDGAASSRASDGPAYGLPSNPQAASDAPRWRLTTR